DPLPCPDAPARAIGMTVAMRDRVRDLTARWSRLGHDLGFGAGIAQGYATLGRIGFEGRYDYAAVGNVTNLAARLCAHAADGQILVSQRVLTGAEPIAVGDPIGDLALPGLSRPVRVYDIKGLTPDATSLTPAANPAPQATTGNAQTVDD
ncbi:MAG TPA: adenylate/guanylate cyclase domain-containing protein, partial [Mycobacterium sp.]